MKKRGYLINSVTSVSVREKGFPRLVKDLFYLKFEMFPNRRSHGWKKSLDRVYFLDLLKRTGIKGFNMKIT